jgi:hypothetical protein
MRLVFRAILVSAGLAQPAALAAQPVHPGRIVRVDAPSALVERFEGVYLGRSGDTLLFGNDDRGPVRVPSAAIRRFEVSAGPSRLGGAMRGALFGGAILTAMSLVILTDSTVTAELEANGDSKRGLVLEGAVNGAFVGALIGLFVPTRKWLASDARILLAGAPSGTNARAGLSLGF